MIGAAAVVLLLGCGEIMGMSNFLTYLVARKTDPATIGSKAQRWKMLFLASFFLTANVLATLARTRNGIGNDDNVRDDNTEGQKSFASKDGPNVSNFGVLVSGLCIGFGTQLGNGCTTGHGICGMARFSKRSIVAASVFMGVGFLTSSVLSTNVSIFRRTTPIALPNDLTRSLGYVMVTTLVSYASCLVVRQGSGSSDDDGDGATPSDESSDLTPQADDGSELKKKAPFVILSGALFAWGLHISQMIDNQVVLNFLDLTGFENGTWDPTLAYVMGSGVIVSALGYQHVEGFNTIAITKKKPFQCPLSGGKFQISQKTELDTKLVLGATMFGFGWGTGGFCPGPATYLACAGYPQILFMYMPLYGIGVLAARLELFQSL